MSAPVWGCPWHGLVTNGQLALPNGAHMAWPQPTGADRWMHGSTALLAHPAALAIVRTEDELAADAAAGMQWWDRAIIAGGTLHGRQLPDGAWIYIDPAGDRWLVTTTLGVEHIAGGTCTVMLQRFGVLGGTPLQYSYDVIVPDMGQAEPYPEVAVGRVSLYHSAPTGGSAVFELATDMGSPAIAPAQQYWRWRPVGWVSVTLSGPGPVCEIAVAVHKTRSQTLGVWDQQYPDMTTERWWLESPGDGSGNRIVREQTPGFPGSSALLAYQSRVVSGETRESNTGYVVGVYCAAGARSEITLSESVVISYNEPAAIHEGPTEFEPNDPVSGSWSAARSATATLRAEYRVDGVLAAQYEISISEQSTTTGSIAADGSRARSFSAQAEFTPGGVFEDSGSSPSWSGSLGGGFYVDNIFISPAPDLASYFIWFDEAGSETMMGLCPIRLSAQMFSACRSYYDFDTAQARAVHMPEAATPAGSATLPEIDTESPMATPWLFTQHAYGSWNPITGEAARSLSPVCWT